MVIFKIKASLLGAFNGALPRGYQAWCAQSHDGIEIEKWFLSGDGLPERFAVSDGWAKSVDVYLLAVGGVAIHHEGKVFVL